MLTPWKRVLLAAVPLLGGAAVFVWPYGRWGLLVVAVAVPFWLLWSRVKGVAGVLSWTCGMWLLAAAARWGGVGPEWAPRLLVVAWAAVWWLVLARTPAAGPKPAREVDQEPVAPEGPRWPTVPSWARFPAAAAAPFAVWMLLERAGATGRVVAVAWIVAAVAWWWFTVTPMVRDRDTPEPEEEPEPEHPRVPDLTRTSQPPADAPIAPRRVVTLGPDRYADVRIDGPDDDSSGPSSFLDEVAALFPERRRTDTGKVSVKDVAERLGMARDDVVDALADEGVDTAREHGVTPLDGGPGSTMRAVRWSNLQTAMKEAA